MSNREKDNNSRWKKGQSGNPKGMPKGSTSQLPQLLKALKKVEKEKQIDYFKVLVERSLEETSVMNAILRKLVPDLKSVDLSLAVDDGMKFTLTYKKAE